MGNVITDFRKYVTSERELAAKSTKTLKEDGALDKAPESANVVDKQAMFNKERSEHPSFEDEVINQIVQDHIDAGKDLIYVNVNVPSEPSAPTP